MELCPHCHYKHDQRTVCAPDDIALEKLRDCAKSMMDSIPHLKRLGPKLAELSKDIASFEGTTPKEELEKMRVALTSKIPPLDERGFSDGTVIRRGPREPNWFWKLRVWYCGWRIK